MKNISRLRRQLERILKGQQSNVLWYLCGLATLPIFGVLVSLVLKLPDRVVGVLIPLLFLIILILSAWLIFLLGKYKQCKRYLNEYHPDIDLDTFYTAKDAFDEDDP